MLDHLLSPGRIGGVELRNRIAMSAMGVEIVDPDGHAREPVIAYYEERARGGAGLIVTEVCAMAYPRGANAKRQLAISDDAYLPGLRELTERVHAHGAKIALQLVHHGKISRLDVKEGRDVLMPSEPQWHGAMDMARDLTPEELGMILASVGGAQPKIRAAQIVFDFGAAAERARRAGFDAVEIHAAHGYLLSEFLSPCWNHRDDEYGGPIENRARLLQEVLRSCKQRAGDDFTVWARIDAREFRTPNGITFEDAPRTAELAVEAGAIFSNIVRDDDVVDSLTLDYNDEGHAGVYLGLKYCMAPVQSDGTGLVSGRMRPFVNLRLGFMESYDLSGELPIPASDPLEMQMSGEAYTTFGFGGGVLYAWTDHIGLELGVSHIRSLSEVEGTWSFTGSGAGGDDYRGDFSTDISTSRAYLGVVFGF